MIGHYDLWVKRGVVSLMGAKLHPSSQVYRVYAPSTHSLPVIKCVSGVNGEAEVEFKSCHSGIYRLKELSPLYQRIWNGKNTTADKLTLKGTPQSTKRTFSVVSFIPDCLLIARPVTKCRTAVYFCGRFFQTPPEATSSREAMELRYQVPVSAWWTAEDSHLRTEGIRKVYI